MSRQQGRKLTTEQVRRILALRAEGKSDTAIAIELDINRNTVAAYQVAWQPACMEPDELAEWRAGTIGGCVDCTVAYSDSMRAVGRCNGVPGEAIAGAVDDTENADVPFVYARPRSTKKEVPMTHAPIELALPPCGSCVHEPVCSIKAALERRLPDQVVDIPKIEPDRRLETKVTVSVTLVCPHFLRRKRGHPVSVSKLTDPAHLDVAAAPVTD